MEIELFDGLDSIPAFNEDRESVLPEAVQELNRRIREADALLVATPEYNGSAPGALKNALDWASRPHGEAALVAKPAAVIGASTTAYGAKWAQEQIRRALTLSGAMVIDAELAVAEGRREGPRGRGRGHRHARRALRAVTSPSWPRPRMRSRVGEAVAA